MAAPKYRNKRVLLTADWTLFELADIKKYNLTGIEGIKFDSKMEAGYYMYLSAAKQRGIIKEIELQPVFVLQDKPKIKYIADFRVTYDHGGQDVIDVKGARTSTFNLKMKLFKIKYPNVILTLVTKKGNLWVNTEI